VKKQSSDDDEIIPASERRRIGEHHSGPLEQYVAANNQWPCGRDIEPSDPDAGHRECCDSLSIDPVFSDI
jgi:hypothetical protein